MVFLYLQANMQKNCLILAKCMPPQNHRKASVHLWLNVWSHMCLARLSWPAWPRCVWFHMCTFTYDKLCYDLFAPACLSPVLSRYPPWRGSFRLDSCSMTSWSLLGVRGQSCGPFSLAAYHGVTFLVLVSLETEISMFKRVSS